MYQTVESRRAQEEAAKIPPSVADYMLLAGALGVPLYTTSLTILQPLSGLIYVILCWTGVTFSYLIRSNGLRASLIQGVGYIHLVIAFLVITNLDVLNDLMPGGGFPWQMAPATFMCWFIIGACYFLWTDAVMLFVLVPGIALFGVQSYIETNANFAISMSLFMLSVAVLLTRLHIRTMKGLAKWAGFNDFDLLFKGPWKAVAGPFLAVVSVLAISLASYLIAPGIGEAVRKLAGEPELKFEAPGRAQTGLGNDAAKRIGNGPLSASDTPVLKVTGSLDAVYLRTEVYGSYVGTGFRSRFIAQGEVKQDVPVSNESDRIPDGRTYLFTHDEAFPSAGTYAVTVESLSRRHPIAYLPPGRVTRFEYWGGITSHGNEIVYISDLFNSGKSYYAETDVPVTDPRALRDAPPANRRYNQSRNTGPFADKIPESVARLAEEAAARGATDYDDVREIIRAIQARVKYNLQAEALTGREDRVEAFLFNTQEGYCDLFASSLTVMTRAIGLKSRLVGGYLAPPEEAKNGELIIRDRHAHLWTEVFFEGIGWVPFDATEGAAEVPGGGVGSLLDEEEDDGGVGFAAAIGGGIFGVSFLALLAGAFWSRLKSWFAGRSPSRKIAPYYADFLKAIRKGIKRPKELSETTREYATAYANKTQNGEEAESLAKELDRVLFSSASLTKLEWANLRRRIVSLSREAKQYARAK
ncbi:MAG: transglutaminase-like domain-containing protein [Fimbriimonadales bacterium]